MSEQLTGVVPQRTTKRCRFCNEEIQIGAAKCKHCGEFLSPAARRAAGVRPAQRGQVPVPWSAGVLALLLCPLLGIIALIYCGQVDSRNRSGDIAGAKSAAQTAQVFAGISALLGLLILILILGSSSGLLVVLVL
jgi:hypothetical protein